MTIETSTPIVFATAPTGSSAPDSITIGGGSIWVEYGNGSSSTGGVTDGVPANSTIVQYSMTGQVEHTYADTNGLADGLKYDPVTGTVWVLNNNDDNSNLQFIKPDDPDDERPTDIRSSLYAWRGPRLR